MRSTALPRTGTHTESLCMRHSCSTRLTTVTSIRELSAPIIGVDAEIAT
ncbi:hypothetical protein BMS3Bbin02_02381 [bacterium BMS3Bbin02]|nr:hypothetical protein BMS3Bbin02_02381 [bacterium BMS3Bbin02]